MRNKRLRRYVTLFATVLLLLVMTACTLSLDPSDDGNDMDEITVTVNIDYPDVDGADTTSDVPAQYAEDGNQDEIDKVEEVYPEDVNGFEMHVEQSATVMEILQSYANQEGVPLEINKAYVISISDIEETNVGRWVYEINGVKIADDATDYVVQNGDVITWKYIKL